MTLPGPASSGRFQEIERKLADEFDVTNLRAVRVATKNLSLAVSGESLQGLSSIKIAEVARDRQGDRCCAIASSRLVYTSRPVRRCSSLDAICWSGSKARRAMCGDS